MTDRRNFLKLLPALFVIPALAKQATKPTTPGSEEFLKAFRDQILSKTQLPPYMLGLNSETDKQLYKIGTQIGRDKTDEFFKVYYENRIAELQEKKK